ncbi:MAG: PD-(D/E)XK nuclease family protein [Flavobacteriales bacterium]|nr:MAG: PD-(D/E)XK nuclease family protein [Flavobacteriales bacterium]
MEPFLRTVAELMLAEHGPALCDVAVVMPSSRSGLHLRKHLAALNGGALWSPEILSWETLCERLSGARPVHDIEALFALRSAQTEEDRASEDLHAFLDRAPIILSDINAIESDLLDVEAFYVDLRQVEGIEQWSFDRPGMSPSQSRLLDRWLKQRDLHHRFKENLKAVKAGTTGMVAREAAENLAKGASSPWKALWFVGLNAMTPAQHSVLSSLQRADIARLCFDGDLSYMGEDDQEAGRSLRRVVARHGTGLVPMGDHLRTIVRQLRIAEVPTPIAECIHAGRLLSELSAAERAKTAVVLTDEGLLLPLLEHLPADIGPLNITMGLRLSKLPVFGLLEAFFKLRTTWNAGGRVRAEDMHALLEHPLLAPALARSIVLRSELRPHLFTQSWLSPATLSAAWSGDAVGEALLSALRATGRSATERAGYSSLISLALADGAHGPFEREQLFRAARMLEQLANELGRIAIHTDGDTFYRLFARMAREQRIPFTGEPLQGLQIMGMLDTRAVDHERLIILSCNEGTLPPPSVDRSFIPFDIRLMRKMSLPSDADALQAYTFHRAVQRAREVHLIRSTAGPGGEAGETRYIHQLRSSLKSSLTQFEQGSYQVPARQRPEALLVVEKSATMIALLHERLAIGLSPSAIGTFLRCPLDFYFKHVIGLREPEVFTNDVGSDVMGTAVHKTLEMLLAPTIGKPLAAQYLREAAQQAGPVLVARILAEAPHIDPAKGHAHLQWDMARNAIERCLLNDAGSIDNGTSITILSLEEQLNIEVPDGRATLGVPFALHGRLDRTELRNGVHRIVDVKTGSVKESDLVLELPTSGKPKEKALQLAAYALMKLVADPGLSQLNAGLVALRKPSLHDRSDLRINGDANIGRAHVATLAETFTGIASSILDTAVPFTHDPKSSYCRFCMA